MEIRRHVKDGWVSVHNNTVLYQPIFSAPEIGAPFELFSAIIEGGKTMETEPGHRETELFLMVRGTGTAIVGGEEVEVAEGDTIYIPPFSDHSIRNESSGESRVTGIKYQEPDKK